MQTNQLKRIHPNKKRMTVARGGKRGKTAGRGGKGQSARAGNKRRPEWRDIIKKLPKLRGRGVNPNKPITEIYKIVNLMTIESVFSANDAVNPATLVEKGVIVTISGKIPQIKILGEGDITKAVKISGCKISESAKNKVEKAGGSVVIESTNTSAKK
jgi:large subunit ribosomal protein L15